MDVSGRKIKKLIKNNHRSFSNASIIKKNILSAHLWIPANGGNWGRLGMPQMWYPKRLKNTARKSERYAHFFISIIFNLNSYLLKSLPVPHDEKA